MIKAWKSKDTVIYCMCVEATVELLLYLRVCCKPREISMNNGIRKYTNGIQVKLSGGIYDYQA
jgi:hypothetical protein